MRLDIQQLYTRRRTEFFQELFKYRRAFANDGLLVSFTFISILSGAYYKQLIEWIPLWFPIPFLLSVGLAIVLTLGRQRTFLKEADLLFLTPIEQRMDQYFNRALRYNIGIQCFVLLILLLILSPLYQARVAAEHQNLIFYFLIPLIAKGWNVHSSWNMRRSPFQRQRLLHTMLRFIFNFILLYWFFSGGSILIYQGYVYGGALLGIALVGFYVYEYMIRMKYPYQWLHLVDMENKLMARFYGFINAFVDVPHVAKKAIQRKWISWVTNLLPFQVQQAYRYLLIKTFLRTDEYSSRYVRLSLVGSLMIWWIPNEYFKLVIGAAFVYITLSQLKGMKHYHQRQFWEKIFPWPHHLLQRSFRQVSSTLIALQSIVFLTVYVLSVNIG